MFIKLSFKVIIAIGTAVVGVIIASSLINIFGMETETAILLVLLFNIVLWNMKIKDNES